MRERWQRRRAPAGRLPDFLIVGAMRAGTTSLAAWLAAHPQVFMPADKELHFFQPPVWGRRDVDWYREQFAGADPEQRAGEATPAYMAHRVFIERMASVVPDARLVVSLRNPVERAWSQYRHAVARGEERSFRAVIDEELARDPADWRTSGMCLARGRYAEQLRALTDYYRRDRVHVVLFEAVTAEPEPAYVAMCRFLGIDDEFRPSVLGQRFDPVAMLGDRMQQKDFKGLLSLPAAGRADPQDMPPDMRAELQRYFAPYNEELADWLGAKLPGWDH
ncbi:MAG: sulfotransferase family protein [Actinomycetes bacterium]